jgi:DNA-nicking Smr family endonuclease
MAQSASEPSAESATPARARSAEPALSRPEPAPSDLVHGTASGIDKRTLARLRRGLIAPEVRLDLHNLRQDEAHRQLSGVLATSQAAGRRCVLVITGKGYGLDGSVGVLKGMVPRWLAEAPNRARVLAFCHAARAHGGEGALYVLLRRSRTEPHR